MGWVDGADQVTALVIRILGYPPRRIGAALQEVGDRIAFVARHPPERRHLGHVAEPVEAVGHDIAVFIGVARLGDSRPPVV